jgi:hypothetical protein
MLELGLGNLPSLQDIPWRRRKISYDGENPGNLVLSQQLGRLLNPLHSFLATAKSLIGNPRTI